MFRGYVVPGDRRGRLLGFPTANLMVVAGEVPSDGIYSCVVCLDSHPAQGGTMSVGVNLTFPDSIERRIEVHLHDFSEELYGRELEVHIIRMLRTTDRLSGPGELVRWSAEDVRRSRALLLRLRGLGGPTRRESNAVTQGLMDAGGQSV